MLATQTLRSGSRRRCGSLQRRLAPGVIAKDLILYIIGAHRHRGRPRLRGRVRGRADRGAAGRGRLTFCNMSIELGARVGLVAPDETTFAYLAAASTRPGDPWTRRSRTGGRWRRTRTPVRRRDRIDAPIAPQVTWGTSPQDVIGVDGGSPTPPTEADPERRQRMSGADVHGSLRPAAARGTPIDYAFIGSCTNAAVRPPRRGGGARAQGRAGVRARVVPGSRPQARRRGRGPRPDLPRRRIRVADAGCSMCVAATATSCPRERSISTTNRNFEGRQGPGSRTHLASPASVAAAVAGDHRPAQPVARRRPTHGEVQPAHRHRRALLLANIDTDAMIPVPGSPLRAGPGPRPVRGVALRRGRREGPDFVLNAVPPQPVSCSPAAISAAAARARAPSGRSIGFGIRCVIAPSFGDIFRELLPERDPARDPGAGKMTAASTSHLPEATNDATGSPSTWRNASSSSPNGPAPQVSFSVPATRRAAHCSRASTRSASR